MPNTFCKFIQISKKMDSVIVRRLCYLNMKQLRKCGQSWRQFTTLSKHLVSSSRAVYPRMYCSKSDKPTTESPTDKAAPDIGNSEEKPFISPLHKPKQKKDLYVEYLNEKRRSDKAKTAKGPNMAVIAVTAVGFVGLYLYVKMRMKQHEISVLKKAAGPQEEVLIGGEWELTNQYGQKITNKDYEGHWCLIYFGFTHCPDICPDEIEKITEVMDILDRNPRLPKLKALFVTVDPDRDSPEAMKNYLAEFSDKIVGLTGNMDELKKILKAFKVYYSMGPKDEDGDYIVDHSIITYLMNPEGKYEAHFARSKTNVQVANVVERKMNTWIPKS